MAYNCSANYYLASFKELMKDQLVYLIVLMSNCAISFLSLVMDVKQIHFIYCNQIVLWQFLMFSLIAVM